MREEKEHLRVEIGGELRRRRGGEKAPSQTEGLTTFASSAEEGQEGRVREFPAPLEEDGER
eukprot:4580565-Prymnesium_polylepis.1